MGADAFRSLLGERLRGLLHVEDEGGVMYYAVQNGVCEVPVFGYRAASEKVLSRLFCRMADNALRGGSPMEFRINLYANDRAAQELFSKMQFGYMCEQGMLALRPAPSGEFAIRTLNRDEITARWSEIWSLTHPLIDHLKQAPVFYPGKEFTEARYKAFFTDECTNLHVAEAADGALIGMIETNAETESLAVHPELTANVGDIYVLPIHRGSGLAQALLHHAVNHALSQGKTHLWVEHGTANPQARCFWSKYFHPYQYQLTRSIKRP